MSMTKQGKWLRKDPLETMKSPSKKYKKYSKRKKVFEEVVEDFDLLKIKSKLTK